MRYRITHKTDYRYGSLVPQSSHLVHLSPRQTKGQQVESHDLMITPPPAQRQSYFDYFGNPTEHLAIEDDHNILSIHASSIINVDRDQSETLTLSAASWEMVRDMMAAPARAGEAEFTCYSGFTEPTPDIAAYGAQSFTPGRPLLDAVHELTSRIYTDFDYDSTVTDASTPVDHVFEIKGGVCQDFAHLQLTCLRSLGLPARYVSGYLRTYPPEGQPRLIGADASHAWISVWSPEAGWVDFDPTNNKMIANEHITLTIGRDFDDVSPISGVILGGGSHLVEVSVDVMPIDANGKEIGPSVANLPASSGQSSATQTQTQTQTQRSQRTGANANTLSQRRDPQTAQQQGQEQSQSPAPVQQQHQGQDGLPLDHPLPADRTY